MGTSLNGLTPANTYQALIKVGNNTNLNTTLKTLSDGAGNDLPMQASTTAINFTGTVSGVASGVAGAIQFSNGSAFASDASNLFWDDTNKRLGIGTNAPIQALDVVGQGRFSDNILFSTDFKSIGRDLNNSSISFASINSQIRANISTGGNFVIYNAGIGQLRFGVSAGGQTTIIGGGSTSATTSLLVQNSAGSTAVQVYDDGKVNINQLVFGGNNGYIGINNSPSIDTALRNVRADNGTSPLSISTGEVGVGDTTTYASAIFAIGSTTRGFLPPRMTTTQKNAIASPAAGLQVFDSTMNATCEYTGTAWRVVSAGAQAVTVTGLLQTVSLADGNVLNITLDSTTTFTFTNPTIGTYILKLTQGVGGGFLVNWPVNVIWSGGTAPTLSTTAGKIDIITLIYDGTSYYGNYSLNY